MLTKVIPDSGKLGWFYSWLGPRLMLSRKTKLGLKFYQYDGSLNEREVGWDRIVA